MKGYMTAQEAADKWKISLRRIQMLCKENRIVGAIKVSRIWIIPQDAKNPIVKKIIK